MTIPSRIRILGRRLRQSEDKIPLDWTSCKGLHNCHLEAERSDMTESDATRFDVRWPPAGPAEDTAAAAAQERQSGEQKQQSEGSTSFGYHHGGEPLNPAWTRHLPCKYGEQPGTWLPYMAPTMQDFNNEHGTLVGKADMGIAISNVTHGSGWQVFDPQCQLHNYLHDYLMFKEPVVPEARNKTIRILYIGDSVDRHPIAWYAALLVSTGFMF